jgi:uncharacterized LabA/DUF88 family protein
MIEAIAVFIDGAYFDKILQDEFKSPKVDYQKLVSWMTNGTPLFRSYYYHCLPYQSDPPTVEEKDRLSKTQSFHYNLSKIPRFEIRLGKLEFRGNRSDGTPIFEQKRVDILLGVDLVLLAAKQRITHAAILAGDSDFLPAITIAKNEGVLISLFHGTTHPPHNELWQTADERSIITKDIIEKILR